MESSPYQTTSVVADPCVVAHILLLHTLESSPYPTTKIVADPCVVPIIHGKCGQIPPFVLQLFILYQKKMESWMWIYLQSFGALLELQLLIPFSEEHGNPDVDLSSEFWSIVGHFLPNKCITMPTHWLAVSGNQILSGKRALNIVTPALIPHLTLERPYMSICCSSSQGVSSSNALWLNNCVPQN